jgi:hypothetical protein
MTAFVKVRCSEKLRAKYRYSSVSRALSCGQMSSEQNICLTGELSQHLYTPEYIHTYAIVCTCSLCERRNVCDSSFILFISYKGDDP